MNRATGVALTALVALAMGSGEGAADAPRVVATIKPIHSLVAAVMDGVAEPSLLIEGAGSPHGYSLRPSQARALSQAQLVFWLGEDLETFLVKPLASLAGNAEVVELAAAPDLIRLPTREAGVRVHGHEGHGEDEDDVRVSDEDRGPSGETDMHLWLDPRNAGAMTQAIVAELARVDPANAAHYEANGAALGERLDRLDDALEGRLMPVRDRPFVVFHDAYQYLEARYGLNAVGAITVDPKRRPSARRLQDIRAEVGELEAACVFAEPQFEPALVATIVEGTEARSAELDPLGAALDPGPEHYFRLLEGLADSLVDCLSTPRPG
jgi:zinc transport system substrate-binding protein